MRPQRLAVVTVLLVLFMVPTPASAGWFWAWFEELSGPKFHGQQWNLRLVCVEDGKPEAGQIQLALDSGYARLRDLAVRYPGDPLVRQIPVVSLPAYSPVPRPRASSSADIVAPSIPQTPTMPRWKSAEVFDAAFAKVSIPITSEPELRLAFENVQTLAAKWRKAARSEALDAPSGVFFSFCAAQPGGPSRLSVDLNYRSLHTGHDDPAISFNTIAPAINFHIFDPGLHDRLDFVDVGFAAGLYWVTTKDDVVRPSSGLFVEPIRFNFHVPPAISLRDDYLWLLSIPYFQVGRIHFPVGFGEQTFTPDGELIKPETRWQWGYFFDLEPIIRRALPQLMGGVRK